MNLKIQLKDADVFNSAQALDVANQVMRAAAAILDNADEDITYTGSEVYWLCIDRLDAFNRKIPGEFKFKQVSSQVYELQYQEREATREIAARDMKTDTQRTQSLVKGLREGTPDEDVSAEPVIEQARQQARAVFKRKRADFHRAYAYTSDQINEAAVAYLDGKPQKKWNAVEWRMYAQALERMDKRWFGERNEPASSIPDVIAERIEEEQRINESESLAELLGRVGGDR